MDNRKLRELTANEIAHGRYIAEKGEEVWHWSSPAGQLRWRRRSAMFVDFLGNKNKRVLEIGCGTGLFTNILAITNNQITAIDVSPPLLELARKRVSSGNVIFMRENAHRTSFKDRSFDFVIGSSVLHHLDVKLALREIYRILKPGGGIMFTEPNMLNPQIALERNVPFIRKLAHNSPDETAFIRWPLKNLISRCGFTNIEIKPFDFMHPSIPEFLLNPLKKALAFIERVPGVREIAGSLVIKARK